MAAVSWTNPGTSGQWGSGPWTNLPVGEAYPGAVPANADAVTLGAAPGAGGGGYTVTFNVPTATLGSLTITGSGSRTTTLQMTAGDSLITGGAITLTNTNSIIDGAGTIFAGGTVGSSGTISAGTNTTGGTLDLTGAGSLASGVTLAIGTAAATTLEIDLVATAGTAISITNANQTLEVGPSGNLTIKAAQTVSGNGTIQMAGGKLTDASGITLGGGGNPGFITGFGTVAAAISRTSSGTDRVTAKGGTLDLTSAFTSGSDNLVLAIDSTTTSTLKIDAAISVSPAISITSANQTLEVGASGALTITGGTIQNVTLGTIKLDGGSLTNTSGISFGAGTSDGSLSGFGTVTGAVTRVGTGTADTITATGGTLKLANAIGATSGLVFDIANTGTATPSTLQLSAVPGTGNTFTFLGASGDLALSSAATFNDGVAGLNVSSNTTATNFVDILGVAGVTVTSGKIGTGTSGTVKLSDGAQLNLSGITNASGTWHVLTAKDAAGTGTDIFLSQVCYAAGTRILTATGERMVDTLLQGDIVLTLSGEELQARPVKWVGRRRIDVTAHPRPDTVRPIRIQRGAIAENMPHTDLLVSPDHAIFVNGRLICARQLTNGTTIRQEKDCASVEYFHVELHEHAILIAEGLPAESYLDTGNRGFFANSGEPLLLHPDLTDESDCLTREAGSCAPFVWDEASVRPVWQRLAERAASLGQPVPRIEATTEPAPCLMVKGRKVKPIYGENGLYIFPLPKGATEVRLVSRAAAPTDTRPWLEDRRRLGLYVERIVLRGADNLCEVPVDDPRLTRGWWAVETGGAGPRRWTDGDAVLPLPAMGGPAMLEVRAGTAELGYPAGPEQEARAA